MEGPDSGQNDSGAQQQPRDKFRRPHKKSRNGCRYCKQRRIKCDEVKPNCGNCVRSSIPCDYSPCGQNTQPIVPRKRGRPRKVWSVVPLECSQRDTISTASYSTSQTQFVCASSEELSVDVPQYLPWAVGDLELFYHYLTAVAVGGNENCLWRVQLPRLAFRRHSVLHLILAISAQHLARQEPSRSAELMSQAEAHMLIGLRRATQVLSSLDEGNCAELYITTILICTYTFAKQPGRRHLLVISEGHEVAWWELFRGVRIVVERIGLPNILSILARDVGPETAPQPANQPSGQSEPEYIVFGTLEWEEALNCLLSLIDKVPEGRKDVVKSSWNMLKWCFQGTFGTSADKKPTADAKFETIMAWLYVLDDEYVNLLKENDAVALVLLAHFAVLLQTLESIWFLEGWPVHIVHGVAEILGNSSQAQWIQWPMVQVQKGTQFIQDVRLARTMGAISRRPTVIKF